ncbi:MULTISPECIES: CvpA family protein [Acinetobacter]|uniref:CvpA family protein n=1 Tax=Acinetobacter TaxID=469 RepID=UPI0015B9983F|nr:MULTISPECIES: CvpA family protein [unclassified Acinetobacter]NWK51021.1 CvpA family protein [Acinetobacter sp. SwsAc5]HHW54100.1 CvpA family protein [Acinetobacter towneri]
MNTIDIVILILLLIGGLNGLRQGFIKAFANLVGWIFALIVAAKYAVVLAPSMTALSSDPVVQKIAAFAFIVLVIVVLTWIVTAVLNGVLKSLKLGPLNRLAGGAFGTLKGLLIVLITIQGIGPWVESSPYWKQSKFVQTLLPYAPWATELSKDAANEALQHIKSKDAASSSDIASDAKENRSGADGSTNNPFY